MASSRFENLPRRTVGARYPIVGQAGFVVREVPVAVGFGARLLGLAHLDRADAGAGLLIPRCAAVHTFGTRFALDVYFLGDEDEVLSVRRAVGPRRFVAHRGAAAVLEIPA